MILIKNARVIDPKTNRDDVLDIVIDKGIIVDMGKYQRNEDYEQIIEAAGFVVAPGLVDVNTHIAPANFKNRKKLLKQLNAAAKGGYTSVVVMPNVKPALNSVEELDYFYDVAEEADIHIYAAAGITTGVKDKELSDMGNLKEHGAVAFSNDGKYIEDGRILMEAMLRAKELDVPLSLHEESLDLTETRGLKAGAVADKLGLKGTPNVAEDILVAKDCMLAISTGAPVHFQHISSPNSVKLIQMVKEQGADVTAEVSPYHFSLMDEDVLKYGTLAKITPPLQDKRSRFDLINGIKQNVIDMIASAETPVPMNKKEVDFEKADTGLVSLEIELALSITGLIRRGQVTLINLIEKLSYNPARRFHLNAGYIEKGAPADMVIFNEQEPWVPEKLKCGYENCPYIGETLYGKVKYTICGGKIVYCDI